MPDFLTDPATGIQIPTPGQDPGPQYATQISNALLTLAHLTHTGPSNSDGYQIPAAGINFNGDIAAQQHNLTDLRSTRYSSNPSTLSGTGDLTCLYVSNGDLYYNNSIGTPVKITNNALVNSTTSATYVTQFITTNLTLSSSSTTIYIGANPSSATILITLPSNTAVPVGRFYIIKDTAGNAPTHNITIQPFSGTQKIDNYSNYVMQEAYGAIAVVNDGANWQILTHDHVMRNSVALVSKNNAGSANVPLISLSTSDEALIADSTHNTVIQGGVRFNTVNIRTNHTLDSFTNDMVLFVETSAGSITITLPTPSSANEGRTIIVKDVDGAANTFNITIARGGSEAIEDVLGNKLLTTNYGSWTFVADAAGNWWMI